jgi:hypothetical protein
VYDVELSQNHNGTAGPPNWVGQTFIATCDSIQWAAFFVGKTSDPGQGDEHYVLRIYDSTGSQPQGVEGYSPVDQCSTYRFLRADFNPAVKVFKGVKYMLKIRHSDTSSVNYYYNDNNPYSYGELIAGGQKSPGCDLATRVEGTTRVPQHIFAVESCMPEPEKEWPSDTANWYKLSARHYLLGVTCDKIGMSFWNKLQKYDTIPASRWSWGWCDSVIALEANNGVQNVWQLNSTPDWARSTISGCPSLPLNLFQPVLSGDTIDRRNSWAYYIYNLYKRYGVSLAHRAKRNRSTTSDAHAIGVVAR